MKYPPLRSAFGGGVTVAPFGEPSYLSDFSDTNLDSSLVSSHLGRSPVSALPPPLSLGFSDAQSSDQFSDSFAPDVDTQFDDSLCSATRIASEARALLLKYQGDLYVDNTLTGASDRQGGRASACRGFFMDADPRSVSGIALPKEFVSALRSCDTENVNRAIPRSLKRAFAFTDQDELQFFSEKNFSPDTLAFASSLRDPSFTF